MQAEPFPPAENDPVSPVLPRLLASADPVAVGAERGLGVHQLREGMRMRWRRGGLGHDELDTTGTRDVSACFVFALWDGGQPAAAVENGGLFGTVGWMALTSPHGLGALAAHSAGASFHLIVELSEAVRTELFQADSETARRGFDAMTRADAMPALRALTPAARLAVESVRRCPLAGACRALVLGARCHDLLVEFISASDEAARPAPMMSDTESRVRAAAAALSRRLDITPSLEALAREAGLSESTLKRGFRQVFGTTVFDHLRALRMERAKQLLQSGDATVIEAATLVGYSNPSNFAAAFRRQFGLNPKEFQLAARR